MKKLLWLVIYLAYVPMSTGQNKYNSSKTKNFDLIHTKLDVRPDWQSNYLYGKAELELKPWFYPKDTVVLDAKGFEIKEILVNGVISKWAYDNLVISIPLGRIFNANEVIKISVDYIAKPDKLASLKEFEGIDLKGLYFINPEKDKPQQLWTEGETEYNSCWFPTLDSPNQKHTQEISITVPQNFETLSNGILKKSSLNADGTKTDTWIQELPHSVYLTMIAAGPFKKVIDSTYKAFEVSYYVEPEFEKDAYNIFGRTPEMIKYFENLLGTKYPWKKYSQIAVRDYISGAMENTTATVHGNSVQKNNNQIVDNNDDGVIAHELFHHWFGDLVTAESWANLALNESFADYSEYLWANYKYGKDEGDWINYIALNQYLNESDEKQEPVIRFGYEDKEDMFDSHSYSKGGRILHMLRNEIGDAAFFAGLKLYLEENKFKNTEIHNLRMAIEAVTGKDLNQFFEQWFLKPGHPRIRIEHSFKNDVLTISVNQQLDSINNWVYTLPITIEIGTDNGSILKIISVSKSLEKFTFNLKKAPNYVMADPNGYILGVIDNIQSEKELYAQYEGSPSMIARLQAFNELTKEEEVTDGQMPLNQMFDSIKRKLALTALNDKFWKIRESAVYKFLDYDGDDFLKVEKELQSLIRIDKKSQVRSAAILSMKNFLNPQNDLLFRNALKDTSYTVRAAALEAILINQPADADTLANVFSQINDVNFFAAVAGYKAGLGKSEDLEWFTSKLSGMSGMELYQTMGIFGSYLVVSDLETQKSSITFLKNLAINEKSWYGRFASAQALMLLIEINEAKLAIKEVFSHEKDERLLNIYSQVPLD